MERFLRTGCLIFSFYLCFSLGLSSVAPSAAGADSERERERERESYEGTQSKRLFRMERTGAMDGQVSSCFLLVKRILHDHDGCLILRRFRGPWFQESSQGPRVNRGQIIRGEENIKK